MPESEPSAPSCGAGGVCASRFSPAPEDGSDPLTRATAPAMSSSRPRLSPETSPAGAGLGGKTCCPSRAGGRTCVLSSRTIGARGVLLSSCSAGGAAPLTRAMAPAICSSRPRAAGAGGRVRPLPPCAGLACVLWRGGAGGADRGAAPATRRLSHRGAQADVRQPPVRPRSASRHPTAIAAQGPSFRLTLPWPGRDGRFPSRTPCRIARKRRGDAPR